MYKEPNIEIWRPVAGYEGMYEISNLGRVKTLKMRGPKIITAQINRYGYHTIKLHRDSVSKRHSIHRLVAIAFLENPRLFAEVNHKDADKGNNCVSNLEWTDRVGNMQHAFKTVNMHLPKGESHHNRKLTTEAVKYIRDMYESGALSMRALARKFLVDRTVIKSVVSYKTWKHV